MRVFLVALVAMAAAVGPVPVTHTASIFGACGDAKADEQIDGTIDNFLQGRTDRAGAYPGDTFFQQPNKLTLQLHAYDLRQKNVVGQADMINSSGHGPISAHLAECLVAEADSLSPIAL